MNTSLHTFNPQLPNIFRIVQERRSIVERSPAKNELVDKSRLINSNRQPPNVKRILTNAAFDNKPYKGIVTKCGNTRCGYLMKIY